jgi:hypothetical protein
VLRLVLKRRLHGLIVFIHVAMDWVHGGRRRAGAQARWRRRGLSLLRDIPESPQNNDIKTLLSKACLPGPTKPVRHCAPPAPLPACF